MSSGSTRSSSYGLSYGSSSAVSSTPLLIGHRGAPRLAPENTMAAFRLALEAGLDGLETDVQRTSDGALVLHHDDGLADGTPLAALSLAALRERAPHVPGIDDLVSVLLDFPTARLNLELKSAAPNDDGRASDLSAHLAAWPAAVLSRTWVSSFDARLLRTLADRLTSDRLTVPLAFLLADPNATDLVATLPLAAVHPHHALVSTENLRTWHDLGLLVNTWTVNEPELASRLVVLGVDGLIGDDPDLLLAARRRATPDSA